VRNLFRFDIRRAAVWAALLAYLLPQTAFAANATSGDRVKAEALYRSGRALLKAGDYDTGCPKFEAAQQLYARATITINIARCHGHFGRITAAVAAYQEALRLIDDSKLRRRQATRLRKLATEEMDAVKSRLAQLRVVLKAAPEGVKVMDGDRQVLAAMFGEAIPVDPGKHHIVATAPGHERSEKRVTLREGELSEIVLSLEPVRAAPVDPKPKDSHATPLWPWIVGAGGVALLGVGVGFKVDSAAADDLLVERCPPSQGVPTCDPASGFDPTADNARKNRGHALFVGMTIGGGVALGAAVTGLLLATGDEAKGDASWRIEPQWGPDLAAARLVGRF